MNNSLLRDKVLLRAELLGSYLSFAKFFYELATGREFIVSNPPGREPHVITIDRELTAVFNLQTERLLINIPPGHHKSTMLSLWVAWCYANHADCNFLYISVSEERAEENTAFIKSIIEMPIYRELFGVTLQRESKAKGKFKTTAGGCCQAFGAQGTIVGANAGLPNLDRFSGGVVLDDMHKPGEVHSQTMREAVINNYRNTISQRPRGSNVPIIFIGQRLHEEDLPAYFIAGKDGYQWKTVILQSLNEYDNPLYPEVFPREYLLRKRQFEEYEFFAQHQQQPQPPGGGIFKREDFMFLPLEPEIISTFLTIDTAETDKSWNDATAMSFFGVYKIVHRGIDSGLYGLHWLNAREIRVEPKDLENEFFDFYMGCMRYRIKPGCVLIEKKSTGVTLGSVLENTPGLRVLKIDRNSSGGNKTQRFYECQPFIAKGQVTFSLHAKHAQMCIDHMAKITGNMSHAHDDIADTLEMAIRKALIEETLLPRANPHNAVLQTMTQNLNRITQHRNRFL